MSKQNFPSIPRNVFSIFLKSFETIIFFILYKKKLRHRPNKIRTCQTKVKIIWSNKFCYEKKQSTKRDLSRESLVKQYLIHEKMKCQNKYGQTNIIMKNSINQTRFVTRIIGQTIFGS